MRQKSILHLPKPIYMSFHISIPQKSVHLKNPKLELLKMQYQALWGIPSCMRYFQIDCSTSYLLKTYIYQHVMTMHEIINKQLHKYIHECYYTNIYVKEICIDYHHATHCLKKNICLGLTQCLKFLQSFYNIEYYNTKGFSK